VAVEQDVDLGEPGPETDGAACQRGPKPDLLPGDPEVARRRDQPRLVRTFLTGLFKGAGPRQAAGLRPTPREASADSNAAQRPPGRWQCFTREPSHAGRLMPRLGPPGHGGVGELQAPEPAAPSGPSQEPAPSARPPKTAILPAIQH
jgi:hypothetical protein